LLLGPLARHRGIVRVDASRYSRARSANVGLAVAWTAGRGEPRGYSRTGRASVRTGSPAAASRCSSRCSQPVRSPIGVTSAAARRMHHDGGRHRWLVRGSLVW